jgi:DICT domain-containing protein
MASLTGVAAPTLRAWETRYGVPVPRRLAGGHRRYGPADVELVRAVLAFRGEGLAMQAAVARARAPVAAAPLSIFAGLRETRPELFPQPIHKPELVRISRAIEDECVVRAGAGLLIGGFQRERFYRSSEWRWTELAASMELTIALADFPGRLVERGRPVEIPLTPLSPLHREWVVIGPAGCMIARERPSAGRGVPRMFDVIWSPDPEVVHHAAATAIALLADPELEHWALAVLGPAPRPSPPELRRAAALTNRIIGYVAA